MKIHRLIRTSAFLFTLIPACVAGQSAGTHPGDDVQRPSVFVTSGVHRLSGAGAVGFRGTRLRGLGLRGKAGPGTIFAQVDVGAFVPTEAGRERYEAMSGFGGYMLDVGLPARMVLSLGPTVGLFRIRGPHLAGPTEDEIVLGGRAEVGFPRWRGWEAGVVWDAQRVHHRRPVDFLRVGVRLGREIGLPRGVARAVLGTETARGESIPPSEGDLGRAPALPPARTLTRDDLERSGIDRMQQLPTLLEGWSASTPNGIASWLSAPGGSPYEQAGWRVFVDGVEFPLALLGTVSLSRLPVSLLAVDSIQVHDGLGIVAGQVVTGGALHFFTGAPRGFRLGGHIAGANGAGEPGLQLDPPNLDRLGGGMSGLVGYGADHGGVTVGASNAGDFLTDPPIRTRTRAATVERLPGGTHSDLAHRMAGVDLRAMGGTHRLRVASSSGRDFFFLAPLGGERVAENRATRATLSGGWAAGPHRVGFTYLGGFTRRSLDPVAGQQGTGLAFEQDVMDLAATATTSRWGVTVGGHRVSGRSTRFALEEGAFQRWEARLTRTGGEWLLSAGGGQAGGQATADVLGSWSPEISSGLRLHASFLAAWSAVEDPSTLWYWDRRGYGLVGEAGVSVVGASRPGASLLVMSEMSLRRSAPNGRSWAEVGVRLRSGPAPITTEHTVGVRAGLPIPSVALVLGPEVRGGRASFWAATSWTGSSVDVTARIDGRMTPWGDRLWKDVSETLPDLQALLDVRVRPAADVDLGATLRYLTNTTWSTWDVMGSEVSAQVDGGPQVDISGRKTLWGGRLSASARLEDLLDADRPSHPFGPSPGLRLHLKVQVMLGASGSGGGG